MPYKVKILKPNMHRAHPVGRLDISVGKPNHEGEKLAATVAWARERYQHVIISVADTLQRHNLMAEGIPAMTALKQSRRAGDEWIQRNEHLFAGCSVMRWDERLNHPLYPQFLERTEQAILTDARLRQDLHEASEEYAQRLGITVSYHRHNYLVEELAVFDMLFGTEPAADIYPGSLLPFWDHESYRGRASFTRIDFLKKSA